MNIRDLAAGRVTLVELLTYATEKVLQQDGIAFDPETETCRYRTSSGAKCLIGHIIPDNEYQTNFENGGPKTIFNMLEIFSLDENDILYLTTAQIRHDNLAKRCTKEELNEKLKARIDELIMNYESGVYPWEVNVQPVSLPDPT